MKRRRFRGEYLVFALCLAIGVARAEDRVNSSGAPTTRPAAPTTLPVIITKDGARTEFRAIGAGEPGTDGWVAARSAPGRFSVILPGRYNDFSVSCNSVKGNPIVMHMVGLNKPGEGKFSVFRLIGGDVAPGEGQAKEVAEKMAADNRPFAKVTKIENAGGVIYECAVVGLHSAARLRYLVRDGSLFMMCVEYSPTAPAATDAAVNRFFDSLKVEPVAAEGR